MLDAARDSGVTVIFKKVEKVFGCDISTVAISRAKKNTLNEVHYFVWDVCESFERKYHADFDCVLFNEVIYYLR